MRKTLLAKEELSCIEDNISTMLQYLAKLPIGEKDISLLNSPSKTSWCADDVKKVAASIALNSPQNTTCVLGKSCWEDATGRGWYRTANVERPNDWLMDELLKYLAAALSVNRTLKALSIHLDAGRGPAEAVWKYFAVAIARHPTLKYLDLEYCGIDDEGMRVLKKAIRNTSLTMLRIGHNNFETNGMEALGRALSSHHTLCNLIVPSTHVWSEKAINAFVLRVHNNVSLLSVSFMTGERESNTYHSTLKSVLARNKNQMSSFYAIACASKIPNVPLTDCYTFWHQCLYQSKHGPLPNAAHLYCKAIIRLWGNVGFAQADRCNAAIAQLPEEVRMCILDWISVDDIAFPRDWANSCRKLKEYIRQGI